MPKGYVIANYQQIHDPAGMAAYSSAAAPVLSAHGGKIIVADAAPTVLERQLPAPAMQVVIEFESVAAAEAWYDSSGYREARAFRQAASDCDVMLVSGFDQSPPTGSSQR